MKKEFFPSPKNKNFSSILVSWCLGGNYFLCFCFFLTLISGCATAPETKTPLVDQDLQNLLSQAASQLAQPNAPKQLTVQDEAKVEWRGDRSLKISVHQIWATRVKPDRPLPPLATLNLESENFSVQKLQLYDMDSKGNFTKSSAPAEIQWAAPAPNLPLSLSKISTARLPELSANQALEVQYTLETKTSSILVDKDIRVDAKKPRPVSPEASFAFLWNDFTPSFPKALTIRTPKSVALYALRLRIPKSLAITQTSDSNFNEVELSLDQALPPLVPENFQPPAQDLAPLTAFTVNKSWDEAMLPYRRRAKQALDSDMASVNELIGDAGSNTALALVDRVAQVKAAVEAKVQWVDTGLPIYLNPDRPLSEIIESGKGTSHDMAMLLACALRAAKIQSQIFLYRRAESGNLLNDMPALSQFDGVLVAASDSMDKNFIWMDPTEFLAAPGILPFNALDRQAAAVLAPLHWKLTPSFNAKEDRKERDVTMEIDADGRLKCAVDIQSFGSNELALRQFFRMTTGDKRRELVIRGLSTRFPGAILDNYQYGDYRDLAKPLNVHYDFEIPNYARFMPKGVMKFYPIVFEDAEEFFTGLRETRQTPVIVPQNFNSVTKVLVKLPEGYSVQSLPKDGSISNFVGEFFSSSKVDFGSITYERYLGFKQRVISPGNEYTDLMNLYQTVLTQDRSPFLVSTAK